MFVEKSSRQRRSATIDLSAARRRDMTVTYGFATQVWLTPEIRSSRQSRGATVKVEVFDARLTL